MRQGGRAEGRGTGNPWNPDILIDLPGALLQPWENHLVSMKPQLPLT